MKTNNKKRANKWERESARLLSMWLTRGKRKDLFWRTNSSGAKGTATKDKNHAGDIVAVGAMGKWFQDRFLIEAKWKKDFSFDSELDAKKWIKRYSRVANDIKKELFIMVKGRKGVIYVIVKTSSVAILRKMNISVGSCLVTEDREYVVVRVSS